MLNDRLTVPEPNSGCLLWIGATTPRGYGKLTIARRTVYAHRVAYSQAHGPIPLGLSVCHRCDTPSCVNPDHLFLGTQRDNLTDMHAKGRAVHLPRQASCRRGHALVGANVIHRGTDRACRACFNAAKRAWRKRSVS